MAFTAADLATIDAAILALAQGKRVSEVRMSDRTLRYAEVTAEELLKLRAQALAELTPVNPEAKRPGVYRARHAKGL